jgi:F0F1-type ATP synthase gamma subunit
VLLQIAENEKAPASARVAAARAIIENAVKAVETLDLVFHRSRFEG